MEVESEMVVKKVKVVLYLPEGIVKYLRTKFKPEEAEKLDSYIAKLIRLNMEAPETDTSWYRKVRQSAKDINDEGKEITAEELAMRLRCKINMAREWLQKMEKHKFVELVRRDSNQKKIFRWIGYDETSA